MKLLPTHLKKSLTKSLLTVLILHVSVSCKTTQDAVTKSNQTAAKTDVITTLDKIPKFDCNGTEPTSFTLDMADLGYDPNVARDRADIERIEGTYYLMGQSPTWGTFLRIDTCLDPNKDGDDAFVVKQIIFKGLARSVSGDSVDEPDPNDPENVIHVATTQIIARGLYNALFNQDKSNLLVTAKTASGKFIVIASLQAKYDSDGDSDTPNAPLAQRSVLAFTTESLPKDDNDKFVPSADFNNFVTLMASSNIISGDPIGSLSCAIGQSPVVTELALRTATAKITSCNQICGDNTNCFDISEISIIHRNSALKEADQQEIILKKKDNQIISLNTLQNEIMAKKLPEAEYLKALKALKRSDQCKGKSPCAYYRSNHHNDCDAIYIQTSAYDFAISADGYHCVPEVMDSNMLPRSKNETPDLKGRAKYRYRLGVPRKAWVEQKDPNEFNMKHFANGNDSSSSNNEGEGESDGELGTTPAPVDSNGNPVLF